MSSEESTVPNFAMVAAFDEKRGLGKDGDLPWYLPEDLKHFARTTKTTKDEGAQNAVIMGRLTYETIPDKYWPLSDRKNVVITRNPSLEVPDALVDTDLRHAMETIAGEVERIFVVGGGQIYELGIRMEECDELIITRIDGSFDCDAFFPEYEEDFERVETLSDGEHEGLTYHIERWTRKRS